MFIHIGPDNPLVTLMKTRPGRFITAVAFTIAFTVLCGFTFPIALSQYRLTNDPGRVVGTVLETKTFGGGETKTEVNTAVRYRFEVEGKTHEYVGPTGGPWADVSKAAMDDAAARGVIDVIYERANPANNMPASKERWLLAWAIGLALVPGGLAALSWVWVVRIIRAEVSRGIG